jgi:very-short-patch-repair endonuclease
VADVTRNLDVVESVVVLDAALHKRLIRLDQVPRHREYVEPATESPMETRLRLLLILAGLPRPQVQVSLGNATSFLGRADLYYPDARLIIEYDGGTHRVSFAADNRRQNRLLEAGYRILRFSASDVLGSPEDVIALVRSALSEAATAPLPMPRPRPGRSARRPGRVGPRAA